MESPGSVVLGSNHQEFSFGWMSCEMPMRPSKWNVKRAIGYNDINYVKWDMLDSQYYSLYSCREL